MSIASVKVASAIRRIADEYWTEARAWEKAINPSEPTGDEGVAEILYEFVHELHSVARRIERF